MTSTCGNEDELDYERVTEHKDRVDFSWGDTSKHLLIADKALTTDQSNLSVKVQLSQGMSLLGLCTEHEEGVTYRDGGDPKVAASPLSPTPS